MSEFNDDEQSLAPEPNTVSRKRFGSTPSGIRRGDQAGFEIVDALAGRASVFGFGFQPLVDAIQINAELYLGDASAWLDETAEPSQHPTRFADTVREFLRSSAVAADSILLESSADMAIERIIAIARRRTDGKQFRTIAIIGSDHGRAGMGRTASGQPGLHAGLGPMMAGFSHVASGNLAAVKSLIDDQTGCILVSPIDFHSGATPIDGDYLCGLRELCDQHGLLLAVDETQLVFGAAGTLFTFSSIAEIEADVVAVASGLFAGLPGALVIANHRSTDSVTIADHADRLPLLAELVSQTLTSMSEADLPNQADEAAQDLAVAIAETVSEFEFVRDVQATGMTIGIQTDLESEQLVRIAFEQGLRIERAGDLAVRLQLPLVVTGEDKRILISRLRETLAAMQRTTAETTA